MKHSHSYSGWLYLWLTLLANTTTLSAIPVWINEIDYDNQGTDDSEFIELAGRSGTSLAGYKIVLYNGNSETTYGSTHELGDSDALAGDANQLGTWVLDLPTNGLQNGPDGIALIFGSTVVQFLSYEGLFTAQSGLASGYTSVDVGVSETNSSDSSNSLQLVGNGSSYEDFSWVSATERSPGAPNAGQSFTSRAVSESTNSAILTMLSLCSLVALERMQRRAKR